MSNPAYHQVLDATKYLNQVRLDSWLHYELFSTQWWFLVATFVLPLIVGWKLVEKGRLMEITCVAAITALIITFLDAVGTELSLWGYPIRLIPFIPQQSEYDYSGLPIVYALLYQYAPKWKSFLVAMIVMAAVYAFLLEPLFISLRIYKPETWNVFYSFPIYIAIGLFAKWLMHGIREVSNQH